jgi:DNA polymerase-3 subunit alpha
MGGAGGDHVIRTGYSFRTATGKIEDVISRVKEIGWDTIPITDRASTFSHNRLTVAALKEGVRPVYGVELAVTPALTKQPVTDHWKFLARKSLRDIHDVLYQATQNFHYEPLLLYDQALKSRKLYKIAGSRLILDNVNNSGDKLFYVGMTPSTPRGLFLAAKARGFRFCAMSDNLYPRKQDLDTYHVILGKRSRSTTYPAYILSDEELRKACRYASDEDFADAVANRAKILGDCQAELKKATMVQPDRPMTLRKMCEIGAKGKCDLKDKVYAERLDRELKLIEEKKFEDYFYVVADMMQWAKPRMICGPGRGSSSGSLVCWLLDITTVDPIKYDLVFERFIDITRADYPDIDVDLSDTRRDKVFEYLEGKYGKDCVARLGTIMLFQSKSCLNAAGAALGVPRWLIDETVNSVITRSKGDSRADSKVEDTFTATEAGKKLITQYPEMTIAGRIESHPYTRGTHAAGVVMTKEPVREFVGIDARTSLALCDWQDAKDLDLLKVDVLGLTQLSIFERTLRMIGKNDVSGFLEKVPLDDKVALDVLNKRHLAGIFQFQGGTTKQVVHQLNRVDSFEDIVSITALCRPGPLGSGGTQAWINRKNGLEPVTFPHKIFQPYLEKTLGVTIYQEQIMLICREIGGMSWGDVTALRKAMGKSLGVEYFDSYRDQFLPNAVKHGVPENIAIKMWLDMCRFGTYGFNRSHAVAYGINTYHCCWLKAHYPVEFAAATLDSEYEPSKQISILRELKEEGVDYVPVDPEESGGNWRVVVRDGKKSLVGPLTMVKGIGPAAVIKIETARMMGLELTGAIKEKLTNPRTQIDTLYPVRDAFKRLCPGMKKGNIKIISEPMPISEVFTKRAGQRTMVVGVLVRNHPLNENEPGRVARRLAQGKRGWIPDNEPKEALNFHLRDDGDDIFCKVGTRNYQQLGPILIRGKPGKSMFAIKGNVPDNFRMIWVEEVLYLGELEDGLDQMEPSASPGDGEDGIRD